MTKISLTEQDLFHKFWNADISFLGGRVTHSQLCCERPRGVDQPVSSLHHSGSSRFEVEWDGGGVQRGHV